MTLIPSGNLNAVTFSPSTLIPGDGQLHQLTVSGAANTLGTFQITAHANDGTSLGTPFQVDVKPRKVINTVTIYSVVAPGLIPPNVPTPDTLQSELNRIFPRQTNVSFTNVVAGGNYNFSYDTDGHGDLYYDVMPDGKTGCYPDFSPCRTSRSELGPVLDAFYLPTGQHNRGDAANLQIFYVNKISKEGVGGYSAPGDPTYPAVLRTDFGTRSVVNAYRENLTAHEIGHILGVGKTFSINNHFVPTDHNKRSQEYLMYYNNFNSAPCRISRDDWNLMNYTPGTLILGKDGKAH